MAEESKIAEKLEEKQSEVKFSEEEIKEVQEIQNTYKNIQDNFGQLNMAKLRLEEQMSVLDTGEEDLRTRFIDIQEKEKKFLDVITEKYGDGTLNPDTGVFTPNKS